MAWLPCQAEAGEERRGGEGRGGAALPQTDPLLRRPECSPPSLPPSLGFQSRALVLAQAAVGDARARALPSAA